MAYYPQMIWLVSIQTKRAHTFRIRKCALFYSNGQEARMKGKRIMLQHADEKVNDLPDTLLW